MNEAKQKSPLVLEHQTDHEKITLTQSIPQTPKIMSIALASFAGTVSEFKSYLRLNRVLIENGLAT